MIAKKIILSFTLLTIGFNLTAASYTKSERGPSKSCTSIIKKAFCFLLLGNSICNQNITVEAYCPTKTKELPQCETITIPKSLCKLEDMSLKKDNNELNKDIKSMCDEIYPFSLRVLSELEDEFDFGKRYPWKLHACSRYHSLDDIGGSLSIRRANRICKDPDIAKALASMEEAQSTWYFEWKARS